MLQKTRDAIKNYINDEIDKLTETEHSAGRASGSSTSAKRPTASINTLNGPFTGGPPGMAGNPGEGDGPRGGRGGRGGDPQVNPPTGNGRNGNLINPGNEGGGTGGGFTMPNLGGSSGGRNTGRGGNGGFPSDWLEVGGRRFEAPNFVGAFRGPNPPPIVFKVMIKDEIKRNAEQFFETIERICAQDLGNRPPSEVLRILFGSWAIDHQNEPWFPVFENLIIKVLTMAAEILSNPCECSIFREDINRAQKQAIVAKCRESCDDWRRYVGDLEETKRY